jgi:hypothetical protein
VKRRDIGVHHLSQRRLGRFPLCGCGEGQSIGAPRLNRLSERTLRRSDEFERTEVDRREVVEVVWVRESVNAGPPARGNHRECEPGCQLDSRLCQARMTSTEGLVRWKTGWPYGPTICASSLASEPPITASWTRSSCFFRKCGTSAWFAMG